MKHQAITSLPAAPSVDRRHRTLEYTVMMSIRVVCLISLIWVRGWWLIIPAAGAILLPYFAVVVANATRSHVSQPERPGSIVRVGDDYFEAPDPGPTSTAGDDATSDRPTDDGKEPSQ